MLSCRKARMCGPQSENVWSAKRGWWPSYPRNAGSSSAFQPSGSDAGISLTCVYVYTCTCTRVRRQHLAYCWLARRRRRRRVLHYGIIRPWPHPCVLVGHSIPVVKAATRRIGQCSPSGRQPKIRLRQNEEVTFSDREYCHSCTRATNDHCCSHR